MARVATIQLLVDDDDPAAINETLQRAARLLEDEGIALAVRIHDATGQAVTGLPPQRTSMALDAGILDTSQVWPEHFVLPFGPELAVDETEIGVLTIHIPSCIQRAGCTAGDVDLRVFVNDDGVQASLLPAGVYDDVDIHGTKAEMSFERAASIQGRASGASQTGVQGRLFDTTTGRPIVGPAFSVPAITRYDFATRGEFGFTLSGVKLDDYMDEFAQPMVKKSGNEIERMYFVDNGTMVPESHVELRAVPSEKERPHGERRTQ
jgi:hypothetical protein